MNRRGVEEVPFRLMLAILLMALLIGISFRQIGTFIEFGGRKNFADDMITVMEVMDALQSTSGYGSFTQTKIRIPSGGYKVEFLHTTNIINITTPEEDIILSPPGKLTNTLSLNPGRYLITIYYGPKPEGTLKSLEIGFK